MQNIYITCLAIGIMFSLANLVLNGLIDGLEFNTNLDLFGLPIKISSIMVALTVFGGFGILFEGVLFGLPFAITGGILSYVGFTYLFYVVLPRYQTETKGNVEMIGCTANVILSILPDKTGKISYVVDGNILSSIAREEVAGNGIERGTKVVIRGLDKDNIFLVAAAEKLEMIKTEKAGSEKEVKSN